MTRSTLRLFRSYQKALAKGNAKKAVRLSDEIDYRGLDLAYLRWKAGRA